MTVMPNSLEEYWMPFTDNRAFKKNPKVLTRAEGLYYWNQMGDKLIDGSSALFNVACGHGRSEIVQAITEQLTTCDYAPSFQTSHPAAFTFARRLTQLLPTPINHVFFTNSGSESVDTALKVALAYHRARNEGQRSRFVSRERAYHGVNMGGTSLSGMVKNRETFHTTLPNITHIRHTLTGQELKQWGQPNQGADLALDLERAVEHFGASTIAACFVEPVAGSTGVLIPPKGYLQKLRDICTEHGILLIFDEVITGFGRLGAPFAADAFEVVPDVMLMAKALTNGIQPMGAVAVTDAIYDTITQAAPENTVEFFHGYTYSGHPGACAAGLATLDIYERENLFNKAKALSPYFAEAMLSMADIPMVKDIRGMGLLCGIEVDGNGQLLQEKLFWNGMHAKFTGNNAIIAPCLTAERNHVDEMVDCLRKTLV